MRHAAMNRDVQLALRVRRSHAAGDAGKWLKDLPTGQGVAERVKQKEWNKELVIYCHNLLETHEDAFIGAIRDDVGAGGAVRSELCTKLGVCTPARDEL